MTEGIFIPVHLEDETLEERAILKGYDHLSKLLRESRDAWLRGRVEFAVDLLDTLTPEANTLMCDIEEQAAAKAEARSVKG